MNKLLIRADIISALNELQSNNITEKTINDIVLSVKKIDDKFFVMKILISEMLETNESNRIEIILFLLNEVFSKPDLENYLFKLLRSNLEDSKKYKLINVFRSMGKVLDYETITQFISEPDKFINQDTNRLIENSLINPELQIDFIDFIQVLNSIDQKNLLISLVQEYDSSYIVDMLIPLLHCDFESNVLLTITDILSKSKSTKALQAIENISGYYKNENEIFKKLKKNILELKLSTNKEKTINNTKFDSTIYKCYISIPDGLDNYGLIISRIRPDNSIQMFSAAVNLQYGILASFGFNEILHCDFEQIANKFYKNEKRIEITPEITKMLLEKAEAQNYKSEKFIPYEYLCWKILLNDISACLPNEIFSYDKQLKLSAESNYINCLLSVAPQTNIWYYDEKSDFFKNLITEISQKSEKIKEFTATTPDKILEFSYEKFVKSTEKISLEERLLLTAYLYKKQNNYAASSVIYSVYSNEGKKKSFIQHILKKSLYYYFCNCWEKELKRNSDVLILKTSLNKSKFTTEFIENILILIERYWLKNE